MHRVLPVVLLLLAGCLGTGDSGVDDGPGAGDSDGRGLADGATDPGGDAGSGTDPDGEATGNGTDGGTAGNGTDPDGPGADNGTSTQTSSSGTETSSSTSTDTGTSDPGTRLLEVSAWDFTSTLTPPPGTEIEVVPNGTWSPDFSEYHTRGPHPMGHHPVSVLHEDAFIVRPDGSSGAQCVTDFMVTEAMEDYTAEAINHVEIHDAQVWIYGPAIPGHPDYDTPYICAR